MEANIHVNRCVHRGGQVVPVDQLTPKEREALARWLTAEYLNELFRGTGTFVPQNSRET